MPHLIQEQLSPEIQELTDKVIAAANGKPLKTSISEERMKEEAAQGFIMQFILKMMRDGPMETSEASTPEKKEVKKEKTE